MRVNTFHPYLVGCRPLLTILNTQNTFKVLYRIRTVEQDQANTINYGNKIFDSAGMANGLQEHKAT